MAALLAFFSSPLGAALVTEVPGLVAQIVAIWAKKGLVTPEEIADFISAQWLDPASLVHKKATP